MCDAVNSEAGEGSDCSEVGFVDSESGQQGFQMGESSTGVLLHQTQSTNQTVLISWRSERPYKVQPTTSRRYTINELSDAVDSIDSRLN